MQITKLTSKSILPLTCSRSGTCCFGKAVMLNPWGLIQFSKEKKLHQENSGIYILNLEEFVYVLMEVKTKKDNKHVVNILMEKAVPSI